MDLKGKLIIITGVSKGIGLATAKALLENGAIVAGWGRNKPALEHANFHFFPTDVQSQDSVEDAFKETIQKLGADVFGLINNAGLGIAGKFEEMQVEDWHTMFRIIDCRHNRDRGNEWLLCYQARGSRYFAIAL